MNSAAPSYGESAASSAATVAQMERVFLCELFDEVGPDAPTLAGDWDTHQLAAHLCLREGNPAQLVSLLIGRGGQQAVDDLVATSDYRQLVQALRSGPPPVSLFTLPHVDRHANALEFFVHHEDVRRAQPGWTARELPTWVEDELWARIRLFAKVLMRRSPVGVELARSDAADASRVAKNSDPVVVRGLPSEVTLFAFGRSAVASVTFDGSPRAVAALQTAKFGV